MGFEDVNREIASASGGWTQLTKVAHGALQGKIVNVEVRDKVFKGVVAVVANGPNKGKTRKEWVFTLDVGGDLKKWAAVESAQYAIRQALGEGGKLEPGGHLQVRVVKDSVQGQSSAEYEVKYTKPVASDPFEGTGADDSPF